MKIETVTNSYRSEKIPDIIKDYRQVRAVFGMRPEDNEETPWWSGDVVKEAIQKDYLCAKALSAIAILNGPADVDELLSAWKEIKSRFREKNPNGYNPKIAQHPFSFFRGTVLHNYLNPNSEKCISPKLSKKIILWDRSLAETRFGQWVLNKLGVEEDEQIPSNIESMKHTSKNPDFVHAKVYKSKNIFGDLTARALTRTSVIGTGVLGGLGAIHTCYKVAQGGDIIEEAGKTALEVGTTIVGMGYLGAIGYKHLGTFGSLLGMGVGTALGTISTKLLAVQKSSSKSI